MKKIYLTALALATGVGLASAVNYSKINPIGRMLMKESTQARSASATTMDVLVETRSQAVLDSLADLGYRVEYISPSFSLVTMPMSGVASLSDSPAVKTLSFGTKAEPTMDKARPASGVNNCHTGLGITFNGNPRCPFKGEGTIIGVFDTGFDPSHINFYDNDQQNTRIKYYVRFDQSGYTPFTGDAIVSAPTDNQDESHGTHVAGIAAGSYNGSGVYFTSSGQDSGSVPLYGVAPEADLAVCAGQLYTSNILLGIRLMINYAREQNKPIVINLSLGSNYGPHDGSEAEIRSLNELAQEAIICISSGNEGDDLIHTGKTFESAVGGTFKTLFKGNVTDWIDTWSSGSKPFTVALLIVNSVTGEVVARVSSDPENSVTVGRGDDEQNKIFAEYCNGTASLESMLDNSNSRYEVLLSSNNLSLRSPYKDNHALALEVNGTEAARYDSYCNRVTAFARHTFSGDYIQPDNNGSINGMACGHNTICVGAYNTRSSWFNLTGTQYSYTTTYPDGGIAAYSSWGNLVDGRNLPHITAPGTGIISSYNTYYVNAHRSDLTSSLAASASFGNQYNYWGVMQGTSMSCPFVTGVVALWLQANPDLTSAQAIEVMKTTAKKDGVNGDICWGAGKIHAANGLKEVIRNYPAGIDDVATDKADNVIVSVDGSTVEIIVPGADTVGATLYSLSGVAVATASTSDGSGILTFDANYPAGVYILSIVSDGTPYTRKIALR